MQHQWYSLRGANRMGRVSSLLLVELAARGPILCTTMFRYWLRKLKSLLCLAPELNYHVFAIKGRKRQIALANNLEQLELRTVLSADPFSLDAEFSVATSNCTLPEGNSGVTSFLFAISRTGNLDVAGSVSYAVTGVSVQADDFGGTFPSGMVNFTPGETRKFLAINVSGDSIVEEDETFNVVLTSSDSGSHIGLSTANGSIINDDADINDELFQAPVNYSNDTYGVGIATGDFNSDGNSDVVLAHPSDESVSVLLSNGDGTLQSPTEYAAGPDPEFVAVGDLNRDGRDDLVVTNTTRNTLSVILGNGDGTFQEPVAYICGIDLLAFPRSVQIVDVNNDHHVDLVCANFSDKTIGVLLGNGDGTFDTVDIYETNFGPSSIAMGDFNEDGYVDIAVEDTLDETFAILRGNGNGTFQAPSAYTESTHKYISAVTSGDFNRDGHIDLAVTGFYVNGTVSILLSDGNGRFAEAASYSFDLYPRAVVFADYNADGVPDLAIGDNGFTGIGKVLPGRGDGTFDEPREMEIDGDVSAMSAGDFNGDGRMDLATGTSILLNQSGGGNKSNLKISATNAVLAEGSSGLTSFTFTVTRSGNISGAASVSYAVSGSGRRRANASNFGGTFPSGTVSFSAGETTKTITIGVSGDTVSENFESFTVTLLNPGPDVILDIATATGLIVEDDSGLVRPSLLSIAAINATQSEGGSGNTQFTFTVTRIGDASDNINANFVVRGTGAHPADLADFNGVLPTGLVTFLAGETTKVVTINVSGDVTVEDDETFTITLANPTNGVTVSTATATGTILNDDAVLGSSLAIAATNSFQSEGQTGATQFTFTVTRSGDTTGTTSANFAVTGSGSHPADAADFNSVLLSGSVNFAPGETSKVITIPISGDSMLEDDEDFTVMLSNPSGGTTIATASASGTILNDDIGTFVAVSVAPSDVSESGSGSLIYTFQRSGDSSLPVTVDFSVSGTATIKKDYLLNGADSLNGPRGSISFAAGQTTKTVTVTPKSDKTIEDDETIVLIVSPSAAYSTGAQSSATGAIIDDDLPEVTLKVSPKKVDEAGSKNLVYRFSRKGPRTRPLAVNFALAGTATFNSDYTVTGATFNTGSGTITFAAGQSKLTVIFNPAADSTSESDETVLLTLSSNSRYLVGTSGPVTGTIGETKSSDTLFSPTSRKAAHSRPATIH